MTAPKKQASRLQMQTVPTIKEFFEQMEQHIDPAHVAKLRAEWTTLTIGQTGEIAAHDPAEWRQLEWATLTIGQTDEIAVHDSTEWRQLMEEYDERIGIMTEGRQITDEDVLAAWESVLDKKQYNGGW